MSNHKFAMPPNKQAQKSSEEYTPRELLEVLGLGTGRDLDRRKLVNFLKKNGGGVIRETRRLIKAHTGFEPEDLSPAVDSRGLPPVSSRQREKKNVIKSQLNAKLEFLQKYKEEAKEAGLSSMGIEADKYIRQLINNAFAGDESAKMNSEVETCNDAAKLTLMAFDDKYSAKIKFEAARKLLLMKFIAEIRDYSKQHEDNDEALQYMMGIFNERIVELPEDGRIGETIPRYLMTSHHPEDFRTLETVITDEKPVIPKEGNPVQVVELPSRKAVVINEAGEEREIFFSIDPRGKTAESRLSKTLRYNAKIGEKDLDRNGLKLVFEKREDWDDFFRMFQEDIRCEVRDELLEKLEYESDEKEIRKIGHRINKLKNCIEISEFKDSLDGNGFEGNCKGSSKDLEVLKFKMMVTRADDRKHQYEFQIFLPKGFADTKFRKGVSWDEYHAKRFFSEKVDELLFPNDLYPDIDRKKAHKKVMKQAHEKVWNGNSKPKTEPTQQSSDSSASTPQPTTHEDVLLAFQNLGSALKEWTSSLLHRGREK